MKAIISLTTWKKRIGTVCNTIRSLGNHPDFPIVLVLSEDEFPNRKIPYELNNVEILWVTKNVRSFKKVLYTMEKYPGIPVISVDDDAIYMDGFADYIYAMHSRYPDCVISNFPNVKTGNIRLPNGYCTLYPPNVLTGALNVLTDQIVDTNNDDGFYGVWMAISDVSFRYLMNKNIATFIDDDVGLGRNQMYKSGNSDIRIIVNELKRMGVRSSVNKIFTLKWLENN